MNAAQSALLSCSGISIEIGGRTLVENLALSIEHGSLTCILGRNGTGKTLTLHTLAGVRATAGEVRIDACPVRQWLRRPLARSLGLLTQTSEDPFPSSVLDAVLVGRHPHLDFWQWESPSDRQIALDALDQVKLTALAERDVATLSGGERRRVAIAALLAQQPRVLLLDEPLNHLDPHHQIMVMRLLQRQQQQGHAVLMSLHDAGLAARFADHVLLLFGNGEWCHGPVEQVLTEDAVARLYGTQVRQLSWEHGRTFVAE